MVVIESSIYDCYFMLVIGGTDVDNVIVFYGNERRVLSARRARETSLSLTCGTMLSLFIATSTSSYIIFMNHGEETTP